MSTAASHLPAPVMPRCAPQRLLQGQKALVTGASSGIGRGIAIPHGRSLVVNGRFRGGYTTRHHGRPDTGVHAIQMELACRGYLDEPETPDETTWPPPFDPARAAPLTADLHAILTACLDWKTPA